MTVHHSDKVSDSDSPGQLAATPLSDGRIPVVRGKDRRRREGAVIDDEASVRSREELTSSRENATQMRENAANLREDVAHRRERTAQAREGDARTREKAAMSRERDIRVAESFKSTSDDQLIMLQQANENLVIASIEAHKLAEQVQLAKAKLDYLAHHDVLTDLPNRVLLHDRLTQAIELARRQGRQLAVMFMDLDQFKNINDSLGHAVGDQLLQSVAQRLIGSVRHSDTVSRQGGDEFVLLLPYIEHPEDAACSAHKILAAIALPHRVDGRDIHIGVSIGISIYPDDGQDAEALIKSADTAMYHAKEHGRNNYQFFAQDMNTRAVLRQSVEADLRRALDRREFILHYQPKINLRSGTIVGVEALIRWQRPEHGLLLPADFVSIAEDCGLIVPIGRWVLREACTQARAWLQAGLSPITIAINTSAVEFRANDFFDNVCATLQDTGLNSHSLELELTESVLMRDGDATASVLRALIDFGVLLAVDDFGTGYSSLTYLRQFPINTLKIDRSFVATMTGNADDATIVSAVINMGKSLNKRVVAEGVETREQYEFLLAQHCDEGQGYYFSRPMEAEALAKLLRAGPLHRLPH